MKEKLIFIITIFILGSCVFAGSYTRTKYYRIKGISNVQLIERIIELKHNNSLYLIFGSDTINDYKNNLGFYNASFYIKKEKIAIYAIVNLNKGAINSKRATIGLDMVLDESQFLVKNKKAYELKELSKDKRKKVIKIFESEILDKLGK